MAKKPKIPGIYIQEIRNSPVAISAVETALPAFIGYTEKAEKGRDSLLLKPTRISSMVDFREYFGGRCQIKKISVVVDENNNFEVQEISIPNTQHYLMYDSLRSFFDNGGKDCFIVSVGFYGTAPAYGDETDPSNIGLRNGVKALELYDEPTLILFPDAVNVVNDGSDDPGFYSLQQMALLQCGKLQDRMCIFDLKENTKGNHSLSIQNFRNNIGPSYLEFGAAYSPFLICSYTYEPALATFEKNIFNSNAASVSLKELFTSRAEHALINSYLEAEDEESKKAAQTRIYREHGPISKIVKEIERKVCTIPPSGAIAGIYARTDRESGVWKSPANVSLNSVSSVKVSIDDRIQAQMNVDGSGKSINAIRFFTGKGILVWGARTLAGNDNEWRYVAVRRFFIMVRESCAKALAKFHNKPNDANTWLNVKNTIEGFLTRLWREGALQGAKTEHAFYVQVGLGRTMAATDIQEGRMILEMGMAPVKPAEFIIIRITQQMMES